MLPVAWVPKDSDFLTLFASVIAAAAALLAVLAGLAQFTGAARARRTIDWSSTALANEVSGSQKVVLTTVRSQAYAQLIGTHYVSVWRFLGSMIIAPAMAIIILRVPARNSSYVGAYGTNVLAYLVCWVILLGAVRKAIRLYCERQRVIYAYQHDPGSILPVITGISRQMKAGHRREFDLAIFASAMFLIAAAAAALVLLGEGPSHLLFLGISLVGFACPIFAVHRYAHRIARMPAARAAES